MTLKELQALHAAETALEQLSAVSHMTVEELREVPQITLDRALAHVGMLFDKEQREFTRTLTLDGKTYGLVPDFSKLTAGEFIDLEALVPEFWPNAHRVMSILYRPVTRRAGTNYDIEPYTGEEPSDPFLEMRADHVTGALLFFWTSAMAFSRTSQQSSGEGVRVLQRLGLAGVGTMPCIAAPENGSWTWRRLRKGLFGLFSRTWAIWRTWRKKLNDK